MPIPDFDYESIRKSADRSFTFAMLNGLLTGVHKDTSDEIVDALHIWQ